MEYLYFFLTPFVKWAFAGFEHGLVLHEASTLQAPSITIPVALHAYGHAAV
jgi:hypothetical protein